MTLKKYANMEVHGVSEILKNFVEFRRVLVGNSTFSTTDGSLGPEGFFSIEFYGWLSTVKCCGSHRCFNR